MAQFPLLLPLLILCGFPFHFPLTYLEISSLAWCDPVHRGPRLLSNWPPPPPLPIPNSQHPRSIVRLTKTTSRSRLPRSGTHTPINFRRTKPLNASYEEQMSTVTKTGKVIFCSCRKSLGGGWGGGNQRYPSIHQRIFFRDLKRQHVVVREGNMKTRLWRESNQRPVTRKYRTPAVHHDHWPLTRIIFDFIRRRQVSFPSRVSWYSLCYTVYI